MSFKDRYKTDKDLEENGADVHMGDGLNVRVRRSSSKFCRAKMRKLRRRVAHLGAEIPPDIEDDINVRWCSEAVLVKWWLTDGAPESSLPTDDDDKPLSYSEENAAKALKANPDFLADVILASNARETYRRVDTDKSKGNSDGPSGGGSSKASK